MDLAIKPHRGTIHFLWKQRAGVSVPFGDSRPRRNKSQIRFLVCFPSASPRLRVPFLTAWT